MKCPDCNQADLEVYRRSSKGLAASKYAKWLECPYCWGLFEFELDCVGLGVHQWA